jgi:hypothetical protein
MSILRQPVTVACNWPGCERACRSQSFTPAGARVKAKAEGWHQMAGLDFCLIHPRHEGSILGAGDGFRMLCLTCQWLDEDVEPTRQDSQARWIAHLPELLGEFNRRYGEPTDVERGAVIATQG